MLEMPRVLQCEHANEADRRKYVQQEDFARAEEQDDQQQGEPKHRRWIHKWQLQSYHD